MSTRQTASTMAPLPELEKPECDEHFTKQLIRAREKINDDALDDHDVEASDTSKKYALMIMRRYGDYARGWKWTINHTENVDGKAPRGFQFSVSPRSPVYPAPFPATSMFNGLMAFPLSGPLYQNLTMSHFADLGNLKRALLEKIDEEADLGVGDDGNFVGFYFSTERGKPMQFWCVTQCHSTLLSREVFKMICDAEPDLVEVPNEFARRVIAAKNAIIKAEHQQKQSNKTSVIQNLIKNSSSSSSSLSSSSSATAANNEKQKSSQKTPFVTWEDLFFKNRRMRDIQLLQRKHRAGVILKALELAGLPCPVSSTSVDKRQEDLTESSGTIDTTFNCVDQIDTEDEMSDIVYLDAMTSVYMLRNRGVVFREMASIGVTLLKMPWNVNDVRERATDLDNSLPFIGVPVGTCVKRSNALLAAKNETTASVPSDVHFWKLPENKSTKNYNLDDKNNRNRHRDAWANWLVECGFGGTELILTPIIVRHARPDIVTNENLF